MTIVEALELASAVQLYEELEKRFDRVVFMAVQDRPREDNPSNQNRLRRYKGHPHLCAGLAFDLANRMTQIVQAQEVTLPNDGL